MPASKSSSSQVIVVGCVSTPGGAQKVLSRGSSDCDWIEVRLDLMPPHSHESVLKALRGRGRIRNRILLTLRGMLEGGKSTWSPRRRAELLQKLLPHVDALDLESRYAPSFQSLIRQARRQKVCVILSRHYFKQTPSERRLTDLVQYMHQKGADISKVATYLKTERDMEKLSRVLARRDKRQFAFMGMGPLATESRSRMVKEGSCLVYGYLDCPTAPGQVPAKEWMKKKLKRREW